MKTGLTQLICKRCGYQWFPRGPVVRVCPKCKSPYWDTAKKFKNIITAMIMFLVAGCGSGSNSGGGVEFVEVTPTEMVAMFNGPFLGYALQSVPGSGTVYLLSYESYGGDVCYNYVLDHELKHIDEGSFHQTGEIFKIPPECYPISNLIMGIYRDMSGKHSWP